MVDRRTWSQRLNPFHKPSSQAHRFVAVNDRAAGLAFPNNAIKNTKYTLLNFVFKNLWEQFHLFWNRSVAAPFTHRPPRYFLLIAILQLNTSITPVNPWTTWGPLIAIFAVSATKEAFDDYGRFQSDLRANTRRATVLRDGKRQCITSMEIRVGDIVIIEEDEEVPCDVVVLSSSEPEGVCYIQTANLDGETDLKARQPLPQTFAMKEEELGRLESIIECAAPNAQVYKFDSTIQLHKGADPLPLSNRQTLLQATFLRNTAWAIAVAVYTGNETKIAMNKAEQPPKWTKSEKMLNRYSLGIFITQLVLMLTLGIIGLNWRDSDAFGHGFSLWYLRYDTLPWWSVLVIPARYLLLLSLMIPISLKVTLDMCKYIYALFINWDLTMYDSGADVPAVARSTALSEDLGQIAHVFTDKTGTLTENLMVFQKASLAGVMYGHREGCFDALTDNMLKAAVERRDVTVMSYLRVLSLCHTVVPKKGEVISYRASSPDELALVEAGRHFGVVFSGKEADRLELTAFGEQQTFILLNVLDFTSDRKRMSVIVRDCQTNVIWLLSKGADDMMLARTDKTSTGTQMVDQSLSHLETFAALGLRTLVICQRQVPEEEYAAFQSAFIVASRAMEERDERLAECYENIEKDLILLGVTAIEDRLQDHVPETISLLRSAGLRFWMLTGDKFSTAKQIGLSCKLIGESSQVLAVRGKVEDVTEDKVRTQIANAMDQLEESLSNESAVSSF